MSHDVCPTCASQLAVRRSTYWTWRVRCHECSRMAHYTFDGWEAGWGVAPYVYGLVLLGLVLLAASVDIR